MSNQVELVVRRLAPIVAAVLIFVIVLQALGFAGGDVIGAIVQGSVGAENALRQSLRWTMPLLIMGLGAVVSFRAGFFNVGGLGQYYMGAVGAIAVTTRIDGLPPVLGITLAVLVAMVCGAVWSAIPGLLRVRFGADEIVSTIMANFVAEYLVAFLLSGFLANSSSASSSGSTSDRVPDAMRISGSDGLSPVTIGITIAVVVVVYLVVTKTSFGVLSGIAGRNGIMLQWQGVKVERIGIKAFAISGALAGLAGAMEILGASGKFVAGTSSEIGNNAMLVALVAGLAVSGAVVSAAFFGMLTAAGLFLPISVSLPASAIVVLNGIIAILVTAQIRYPGRWRRRRRPAASTDSEEDRLRGGSSMPEDPVPRPAVLEEPTEPAILLREKA